ncbi:MAG: NAD(+)/NADH kinase [Treponema sp.]|nr:NAD(+)/NADH kinase [Treponema sp.]
MKRCLIIQNTFNNEIPFFTQAVVDFLIEKNIDVNLVNYSGQTECCENDSYDFAVTLGGDGTVLFATRCCALKKIPIFPINLGEFGFIAGIQKNAWQKPLEDFINGKLLVTKRTMLQGTLFRDGEKIFTSQALNDIVISAQAAKMLSLNVVCNGFSFGVFKSDGIIAATSTGSTAYSASAGGPLVDPTLDAIILSSICPFSLAGRPLVLPHTAVLDIEVLPSRGAEPVITYDGQISVNLKVNDKIKISISEKKALLVGCDSHIFYEAIQSKMHWFGGVS